MQFVLLMSAPTYAVVQTGGKQYRVQPGEILQIEKLEGAPGTSITFDEVLFWSNPESGTEVVLGRPLISGAKVTGEVIAQGRGEKIITGKYNRKKQYRREIGHRQEYTQVIITALENGKGGSASLSDSEKKATLAKFQSHLKPWGGKVRTPKVAHPRNEAGGDSEGKSAPRKAAAKKPAAKSTAAKKK